MAAEQAHRCWDFLSSTTQAGLMTLDNWCGSTANTFEAHMWQKSLKFSMHASARFQPMHWVAPRNPQKNRTKKTYVQAESQIKKIRPVVHSKSWLNNKSNKKTHRHRRDGRQRLGKGKGTQRDLVVIELETASSRRPGERAQGEGLCSTCCTRRGTWSCWRTMQQHPHRL